MSNSKSELFSKKSIASVFTSEINALVWIEEKAAKEKVLCLLRVAEKLGIDPKNDMDVQGALSIINIVLS